MAPAGMVWPTASRAAVTSQTAVPILVLETPSSVKARVKVSSGWGATYNAVVGVGDITGDGKADLVARDTNGNLYRQSGNGKGGFGSRTKIATGWKAYKGLF
jgi:hypothetical protein